MNDQSVQPTQIPQEVRSFLDDMLEQAGMLSSLDETMHEEMLTELYEQLDKYLTTVILENIPEDKLEEFMQKNEQQVSKEDLEIYLRQQIPNVNEVMANAFAEFRNLYLGNVAAQQSAPSVDQTEKS